MKTKHLILSLGLLSLFSAFTVASPLGTAFTYQGRLSSGTNAANGTYDLKFTLYDALSSGSIVAGPLTNATTGVTNGLFTTTLDFGASVFTGYARWLEMGVRTNGSGAFTTLSPRQALTPAPYSLFASNTALLNGQAASAFAPASGSTAYVTKSGDTMTGTLNLPANGLAAGGSQLVLSGSKVGIGTITPQAGLEVAGPGIWNSSIGIRDTTTSQDWRLSVSGFDFLITKVAGTTFTPFKILGTGMSDSLVIGAGGNVGIGTATPTAKLDVAGTVKATSFSGSGAGLTSIGLLQTRVLDVNTIGGVNFSPTYVKVGDVGSFTKLDSGSTIEITFHGRINTSTQPTGTGAIFEMRVDNVPTTNGRARTLIKYTETGWAGVNASITGIFTGLAAGSHTVSFWVEGTGGSGTGAVVAGGNFGTDHIVVKEFK